MVSSTTVVPHLEVQAFVKTLNILQTYEFSIYTPKEEQIMRLETVSTPTQVNLISGKTAAARGY